MFFVGKPTAMRPSGWVPTMGFLSSMIAIWKFSRHRYVLPTFNMCQMTCCIQLPMSTSAAGSTLLWATPFEIELTLRHCRTLCRA